MRARASTAIKITTLPAIVQCQLMSATTITQPLGKIAVQIAGSDANDLARTRS